MGVFVVVIVVVVIVIVMVGVMTVVIDGWSGGDRDGGVNGGGDGWSGGDCGGCGCCEGVVTTCPQLTLVAILPLLFQSKLSKASL